jgi:AraC-like DNA-binding protein
LRALPNLGVAHGVFSKMRCRHSAAQADSDDLVLLVAVAGEGVLHQGKNSIPFRTGQAVLTSNSDTGTLHLHSQCQLVNFRLAYDKISPLIADLKSTLYKPIPASTEALRLLMHYAEVLHEQDALATPSIRNLVATHINDLAALTVGATFDAKHLAGLRGMRAARLRAIKADIVENIGRRKLTPDSIAARHGVSTRYVRMMFESEGTSLSEFLLGQRLARVHSMLTDPRHSGRSISEIAFDVGFGDLSYFNRVFRARFGMTPSDLRMTAMRQAP